MADRTAVPQNVQNDVLTRSARRCALCFGLDGSLKRVDGQIAHVDRNSANAAVENLAFLCFDHHNEYDSKPSQAKGLVPGELILYRDRLYAAIERNDHHRDDPVIVRVQIDPNIVEHERAAFLAADRILPEFVLFQFVNGVGGDHSFETNPLHIGDAYLAIGYFVRHFALESNRFVLRELAEPVDALVVALNGLLDFLREHFFDFSKSGKTARYVMHPELNSDRGATGDEPPGLYGAHALALGTCVNAVEDTYREYRRTVKRTLLI
jgi:hypothetical protein